MQPDLAGGDLRDAAPEVGRPRRLTPADLRGLWQRDFIEVAGLERSRTTLVLWLQGGRFFCDLRQPACLPEFDGVRCLRDLSTDQLRELATQEGFAGTLQIVDGVADWTRVIDFQPATGVPDRASVALDGDTLTEVGTELPYLEQWSRVGGPASGMFGARVVDEAHGQTGVCVRAGPYLMFARDRAASLRPGMPLSARLAVAATLRDQQDLLDFEVSFGRLESSGCWHIERSSLPFKAGRRWSVRFPATPSDVLELQDVTDEGELTTRRWRVTDPESPAPDPGAAKRSFREIPIIDIGELMSKGAGACPRTVAQIASAARDVGFFVVTGHGCPGQLQERLLDRAREFFAQPIERRMDVYIGRSRNHRGYVPAGEEVLAGGTVDLKESFDLSFELAADDPDAMRFPLLGPNQWPALPGFAQDVTRYYQSAFDVGRRLMQAFAVALGCASDHFDRHITRPPSQLRLIHYPVNPAAGDTSGIGAHTDYECLTVLLATGPGLEVLNGLGEWIDAPPVPGALTINIGDMIELLSDGRFVATTHRVRKVSAERYSFPLFFSLDYPTRVEPVSGGRPGAPSLVAGEHLYAQTIQTFSYLRARLERGDIAMPEGSLSLSSFGYGATKVPPGRLPLPLPSRTDR